MSPRPELPRVVDQLRILLWLQTHLTLVGLLVVVVVVGYLTNERGLHLSEEQNTGFFTALGLLAGTAAVLALCATLMRRRWWWVYVLIAAVEVTAVVAVGYGLTRGHLVTSLGLVLYVALVAWVVVDLVHPEVRTFMLSRAGTRAGNR
ncbi:hypothetical protein GCM10009557_79400 [Virgisporangium ochraceum]|uniref:Uncharacterized protein n=1 Tax=Virgisporangium ochraceum TaxID=65505 RepID=A0A8J3ZWI2_9ACTN|nr:hypothetical protein [Virgisporangium ochraceum]GIJ70473.1 hypothetical protein Voc01_053900 [Virgisporangium ochraceum]